ncbi:uncharacterized protein OCT59_021422 [Rhizophagus irregularis]|uniref:uncharacterized protein n=1 Tax=Rhizophagus irregularis TaxID=588596 RepID=UPI00332A328F|nr:hypothetical protein OCT59_021422 [Rhizophagus irregularis]
MPPRKKKSSTLQSNNKRGKGGKGSTVDEPNKSSNKKTSSHNINHEKTPLTTSSREKTPTTTSTSHEKTPASREKTPTTTSTKTPISTSTKPSSCEKTPATTSSPEKTPVTVYIDDKDFSDSLSELSWDKNKAGIERLQEQRQEHGRKYQRLDLDDIIEPLSDSTFISSSRKSKSSVTSSILFNDWDNWKLDDDEDLNNDDVQNRPTTSVTKHHFSKEPVSRNSAISSEDINSHEISSAIANILQPENLEVMIRTAVNREVEKRVKSFFDNRADFILSSSSSYLSSAPQTRKYRDQNHVITTVMEFTKPLFMKMRNLSDTALELIINAMWPEKPTFADESDINVARSKAKKFFQAYRCNLNNDLSQHADNVIERYKKEKNIGRINTFTKSIIIDYVSDDFTRDIFNTYMIYTPTMKDDVDALNILKSFLCRALSHHIGEKLNGNSDHEATLHKVKSLDYITKDLVLKSRLYANIINNI